MNKTFDPAKVGAAMLLGLVATCPECGGSGGPVGEFEMEGRGYVINCDCEGSGFYVTDEAAELFGKSIAFDQYMHRETPLIREVDEHRLSLTVMLSHILQVPEAASQVGESE